METEHGNGNLQSCCYSSNSSPVRFAELYKPSHWYTIVVKFFLKFFLLHNALSNKRLWKTIYRLMSFVIYYNYTMLLSSLLILTLTVQVCYNCFNIWLNDVYFQYRNNRHLWLKRVITSAPIALTKTYEICCNSSQLSSYFITELYRTVCVKRGYHLVLHCSHSKAPTL